MNRTLKDATVKKYHYQTHHHMKAHLQAYLMAYNFEKRLKTLKGLTPYEDICQCWQKDPERFTINPYHHILGLNILLVRRGGSTTTPKFLTLTQVGAENRLTVACRIP